MRTDRGESSIVCSDRRPPGKQSNNDKYKGKYKQRKDASAGCILRYCLFSALGHLIEVLDLVESSSAAADGLTDMPHRAGRATQVTLSVEHLARWVGRSRNHHPLPRLMCRKGWNKEGEQLAASSHFNPFSRCRCLVPFSFRPGPRRGSDDTTVLFVLSRGSLD